MATIEEKPTMKANPDNHDEALYGNGEVDVAKKYPSYLAVDECLKPGMTVLGIGSGTTVIYCVERINEKVKKGEISIKACIPTSFQAKEMILEAGLPLGELNQYPRIDIVFDGADEVDEDLNCIKGGGGCHFQEKLIAKASKFRVIVADGKKLSTRLGTYWKRGIPIEVHPMAYVSVSMQIRELGGIPNLRYASTAKAGPLITDNGNFILDTIFDPITSPRELEEKLRCFPGVIEVGIFHGIFDVAYFGYEDGSVKKKCFDPKSRHKAA